MSSGEHNIERKTIDKQKVVDTLKHSQRVIGCEARSIFVQYYTPEKCHTSPRKKKYQEVDQLATGTSEPPM